MSNLSELLRRSLDRFTPSAETDAAILRAAREAIAHHTGFSRLWAQVASLFTTPVGVGLSAAGALAVGVAVFMVARPHDPASPSLVPAQAARDGAVLGPAAARQTVLSLRFNGLDRNAQLKLVDLVDSVAPCARLAPAAVAYDDRAGVDSKGRRTAIEAFLRGATRSDCPAPVLVSPSQTHDWSLILVAASRP